MTLTPDEIILAQWGPLRLNATIVFTWIVMALLVGGSWLVTRNLQTGPTLRRRQTILEGIVVLVSAQIRDISRSHNDRYLPFIGTLFLFIALSNLLGAVPGFQSPTGSLSTTAALAISVFFAVPFFGIRNQGARAYFHQYIEPNPILLPFNIIGELSRTLSLAVRLFGNIMSGSMIGAILLTFVPLIFPVFMSILGLLTGMIQAYIFSVLATVFIASSAGPQDRAHPADEPPPPAPISSSTTTDSTATTDSSATTKGTPTHG